MGINRWLLKKLMLDQWEAQDNARLLKQKLPDGIRAETDVPYIDDGHLGHLLDVYYPENAEGKLPAIVDLHPGGLVYGDKGHNKSFGYHLAMRGFCVFNINYRLALYDTKVPGQLRDVMSAIRWITEHPGAYPADQDKMFITGSSAGGYLAAMAALIAKSVRLQKIFDTVDPHIEFKGAGIICGMMDLNARHIGYWGLRSICLPRGYKRQPYYQNMIFENLPEIKEFPPVFLTSSDDDQLSQMTLNFERTLKNHGVPHQMRYFPREAGRKYEHIFSVMYPERAESADLFDEMLAFFRQYI